MNSINIDDIPDIKDLNISKKKSSKERILDFLNEVNNPYVFKVNGRLVMISFANTETTAMNVYPMFCKIFINSWSSL